VWIQETLPEIYRKKIEAGWRIFYQDEVGFQTEGALAYTWGVRGQSTAIANYGRHGRINLIGAFELGAGLFYGVQTTIFCRCFMPLVYVNLKAPFSPSITIWIPITARIKPIIRVIAPKALVPMKATNFLPKTKITYVMTQRIANTAIVTAN
jgi:hypothetical protein